MNEMAKDREYILKHPEEFKAALEKARAHFLKFEGVIGVGFGQKHSNGDYVDNLAIVITVNEKKKEEDVAPEDRIPKSFEGFSTDVVKVLNMSPGVCNNSNSYDTIQGGIQICPPINTNLVYNGTLGCIVRRRGDTSRENVHLLSNKHVLQAGGVNAGQYIYHPNPPTPQGVQYLGPSRSLGEISANSFYQDVDYTSTGATLSRKFFLDCGTAIIHIDSKCLGSTCTKDVINTAESIIDLQLNSLDPTNLLNTLSDVRSIIDDFSMINQRVYKVGRTTGKTAGIVRRIDISGTMPSNYDDVTSTTIPTTNVIEIDFDASSTANGLNCNNNARFGEHGDSGSIVVDAQSRVIGILYGVPPDTTVGPASCTASHILPVLDNLGICIPTAGGTSPGSCGATDGSGLTPGPSVPGSGGLASAISARTLTATNSDLTSGLFQTSPLTTEQQDRLTRLLQAFRSTSRGRDLHEAFGHVRREIGYLVRNRRPVTVTWHRNKGPAFFAAFLNHLRGDEETFPNQVGSAELSVLLDKMEVVLREHGSIPLRETIEKHGQLMKSLLVNGNSVDEFIAQLNQE